MSDTEGDSPREAHVGLVAEPVQTLEDFLAWVDHLPEGLRFEVVDGRPVVAPSPTGPHQVAVSRLLRALAGSAPNDLEVVPAPLDWVLWQLPSLTLRQPDLLIVSLDQARAARVTRPPLLVVEILSPASVETDLVSKRRQYARAGAAHYWIVDPTEPEIVALALDQAGDYREVARAAGTEPLNITAPFPFTVVPADLVP